MHPAQDIKESYRQLDDAALASRVAAGDQHAFKALMRRYNRKLYRTARSVLRDDAEAEDALQEAYLMAYRAMGSFRSEASLSTWLTRIVVNAALARLRKSTRRAQVISLDGDLHPAAGKIGTPDRDEPDAQVDAPEQAGMRADVRRILERKIDQLPESFRTVFMLRALEEMTVEEVSAALQIPEATVRSRYFRARSMLRESLSREIDFAMEDAFGFDGERCDRIVAGVLASLSAQPGQAG